MTNLPAVYVANGAAILFLLTILLSFKKPLRHGLLDERIYNLMVHLNILQCLLESVTFFMDGKVEYYTLTLVLNVILFINSVVLSFSWVIYADYKLFSDVKRIKQIYPWLAIPAALTIIGCLLNLVTPVFFAIDQYNVYHRTSLFIIPYVVTYFYFAYGVILINVNRKKVHKRLFLPATLFMVPVAIGSVLQILFYGYSFVWLGVSIGMMSLFINVQNEASYVDVLSGLYNRQYLNNLLLMYSERKDTDVIPVGIMLDIDNFKSINDQFGHAVGDEAIFTAGKILHTAVHDKGKIFRYGGDEFVILMLVKNSPNTLKEIMDMIDLIKAETTLFNESNKRPYKIKFSFGYSTFHSKHDSIDDFLNRIDTSMYEDKKRKFSEGSIIDKRNRILMAKGNE